MCVGEARKKKSRVPEGENTRGSHGSAMEIDGVAAPPFFFQSSCLYFVEGFLKSVTGGFFLYKTGLAVVLCNVARSSSSSSDTCLCKILSS